MRNYAIKQKQTVIKWINAGLIPGANFKNNYVPDSARPPYTKARAKNANTIYTSIVKASYERRHVLPSLYRISEDEFNGYIDRLVRANLICKRVADNITYYDTPINANNCNKNFILQALEACLKGISEGVTKTLVKLA